MYRVNRQLWDLSLVDFNLYVPSIQLLSPFCHPYPGSQPDPGPRSDGSPCTLLPLSSDGERAVPQHPRVERRPRAGAGVLHRVHPLAQGTCLYDVLIGRGVPNKGGCVNFIV